MIGFRITAPDRRHGSTFACCRGTPDAVAIACVERPRKARSLNRAIPAQSQGRIRCFSWSRKECLRILTAADTARSPRLVRRAFGERSNQSWVSPCRCDLVWSRHACSGHYPPPPRVLNNSCGRSTLASDRQPCRSKTTVNKHQRWFLSHSWLLNQEFSTGKGRCRGRFLGANSLKQGQIDRIGLRLARSGYQGWAVIAYIADRKSYRANLQTCYFACRGRFE